MTMTDDVLTKMEQAKLIYRERDFAKALQTFLEIIDMKADAWEAKLYIAMCYYKLGTIQTSAQHFRFIAANCPDEEIRLKAEIALGPINEEARTMTITNLKKPDYSKYVNKDEDEVQWSGEKS